MISTGLAHLVRNTAVAVLTEHGYDSSVLPDVITIERPRSLDHGDYSTNLALQIAKKVGVSPRELAQWLASALCFAEEINDAQVAGPGFVNLWLDPFTHGAILTQILDQADHYGESHALEGLAVNLEFVSANPTGPIHIGGTRWAAVGDALGRILSSQGAQVTREYYFNDHGSQIDRFVDSLQASAHHQPPPEDGYRGEYITEIAQAVCLECPNILSLDQNQQREQFRHIGVGLMFDHIKRSLHEFGTDFDVYTHEDSMHTSGQVDQAIQRLQERGAIYSHDGALWLRSSAFGDDKDRVVIKSDGHPAYIAGDLAYYLDKRRRGFNLCIYMLGADHHGYIQRLKAAVSAFGDDPNTVEVLIGQMVNLISDGQPVRMSKRAGTVLTLDDLVEAIGVDAARYALIRSSVDTPIDLDLDLWSLACNDNPVYYVQYAHARLSSLMRNAADLHIALDITQLRLLHHDRERLLVHTLGEFPDVLASAARLREPHRLCRYLEDLAGCYHRFYDSCRVLPQGEESPTALHRARLALCEATRQVLANGLGLLGVSAPERM